MVNQLTDALLAYSQQKLHQELDRNRVNVFGLISYMWIDDMQDNFIEALNRITPRLGSQQPALRYLTDMRGIANYIDNGVIYRTFLKKSYPELLLVFSADCLQSDL